MKERECEENRYTHVRTQTDRAITVFLFWRRGSNFAGIMNLTNEGKLSTGIASL